jgi:hypothetical protein
LQAGDDGVENTDSHWVGAASQDLSPPLPGQESGHSLLRPPNEAASKGAARVARIGAMGEPAVPQRLESQPMSLSASYRNLQ